MKRMLFALVGVFVAACLVASPVAAQEASSTATGISRLMNPAVSLNTLLLGQVSDKDDSRAANTFEMQEMEIQFSSVVDPFWIADVIVAFHPEEEEHGEGEEDTHGSHYALDIEKAIVEYQNMPRGLGLRVGKDYLPFGRQIPLHTHQYPFVKAPVGVVAFAGDHSLSGTGVELAWNVPLPWWAELKAYGMASGAEIFDDESRDLVYGTRLNNLWDVSDNSTFELGFSALTGPGAAHGMDEPTGDFRMYGADLAYKWQSSGAAGGPALNFVNEILMPDPEHGEGDPLGFASHVQYRFARQWWVGVGVSFASDTEYEPGHHHEEEAGAGEEHGLHELREWKINLTLAPSEFSALRCEIFRAEDPDGEYEDFGAALQVNFTIGSHPAHAY